MVESLFIMSRLDSQHLKESNVIIHNGRYACTIIQQVYFQIYPLEKLDIQEEGSTRTLIVAMCDGEHWKKLKCSSC